MYITCTGLAIQWVVGPVNKWRHIWLIKEKRRVIVRREYNPEPGKPVLLIKPFYKTGRKYSLEIDGKCNIRKDYCHWYSHWTIEELAWLPFQKGKTCEKVNFEQQICSRNFFHFRPKPGLLWITVLLFCNGSPASSCIVRWLCHNHGIERGRNNTAEIILLFLVCLVVFCGSFFSTP